MRQVDEVSPGVFVATSRRDCTTSTVVVDGSAAVLVDPAWEADELDALAELTAAKGWTVEAGLATHAHHDHLLWHPSWGDVPTLASERTVVLAAEHREELVVNMGPDFPARLGDLLGHMTPLGNLPGVEPVVHDGDAPGHSAYWWPERGLLVAGDMLSDLELPLPLWPDDLPAYLAGLEVLAPYVARAAVLVPGHGRPTASPLERLDADRRYLDAVIAGRDVDDPRRANDGMAEIHERIVGLARAL